VESRRQRPVPDARLLTGIAGISVAVFLLVEFFVRVSLGPRPPLDESAALAEFIARTSTQTLVITLADTLVMASLIVFLAGFRRLVELAEGELEWMTAIILGAGLTFVGVTLVGDSLEAGAALGTVGNHPDPSAIRALTEGYLLIFGPISYVLIALVAVVSGYVIFASGAFPRWTGVLAIVVAALNFVAISFTFGGTDNRDFYSVGGWGGAGFATFPWLAWVVVIAVLCLSRRRAPAVLD
jgi:hypothetical protein